MKSKLDASQNYSYLAIAAFFGFLGFMLQPTAYTWGEQDMMPFFERVSDPNFLINDFFTNTTATKNPRWIYGYFIIGLSWVTTLSWYNVLYVLKLVLAILKPVLYFQVLLLLIRRYVSQNMVSKISLFVLTFLILMVLLKEYRYYFTVASWQSYSSSLHAYNIAVVLSFFGILLKERHYRPLFYLPFFFLSCLVHPAVGPFAICFYAIFLIPEIEKEIRRFLPVLVSAISAIILVKFFFTTDQTLASKEFIEIYVKERHSWHYSVLDFINKKGDWKSFFILMIVLFLIPLIYSLIQKRYKLLLLSFIALISYTGVILMQYLFIDIMPWKLMAYLGVSRFTTFGYWMLIILWSILVLDLLKKNTTLVIPSIGLKYFIIIVANLIFVGIVFLDNPIKTNYINQKAYYDFVRSTPEDAIFITYMRPLNTDMRMIGRRGVFIGDEFPFSEQDISEYGRRYKMIYGSRKNEIYGRDFYRELRPKDFWRISEKYRLDYIVIENGFDTEFANNKPVWRNHKYSIYSVENLIF